MKSHSPWTVPRLRRGAVLLAALLCLALPLSGCDSMDTQPRYAASPSLSPAPAESGWVEEYHRGRDPVPFAQMTYVRPDLSVLRRQVRERVDIIQEGGSLDQAFAAMLEAGSLLDQFLTMYALSDIYSDMDLEDDYWLEEWYFCSNALMIYSSLWTDVYEAVEQSGYAPQLLPLWNKAFDYSHLLNQDRQQAGQIYTRINAITHEALDIIESATVSFGGRDLTLDEAYDRWDWVSATEAWCLSHGPRLLELYTQLAAAGGELARDCFGYGDYSSYLFATYQRDYTPQMALALTDEIAEHIVALDVALVEQGYWNTLYNDYDTFDGLMETARTVLEQMGGEMTDALDLLLEYGLYYVDVEDRQYERPYVIRLATPNVPFLYCPYDGSFRSAANFTHELGHFYEMYLTMEDYSIPDDLSEVHSQAMALLFAQTLADQTGDRALLESVLTDTVDTLVSQSLNAAIELRVFALAPEALTAEAVGQIGREQSVRFGWRYGNQGLEDYLWLTSTDLFANPLQPLCYTVSGGAALELWALSLEDMDLALDQYDRLVRHPQSHQFLYNLEAAGLTGPFASGWAQDTAAFLRGRLLDGAWAEAA